MSKKADSQKNQRIQVFARCRPLNSIEKKQYSPSIVEVIPEKKEILLKDRNTSREFFFDKVFSPDTKQIVVYKAVVGPLIQEVLNGYNCTVFAYGQTGTGKTYTMEGERNDAKCSWEDDPAAGIIPRALHQLFEELGKEENVEFSVRVSFLELYNEELFDLLSSTELSRLKLYEDTNRKGSVIIQGLEEIMVNNKDEVYSILEKGTARRQTAATMLNATSSRSHTVFSVTVHIKENTIEGEELLKTGKLNLVDLAGSENVGRSGAIDKRAREAGNINQSLLTLGRVITALIEKQPHIPYRESKLTRLLQDSLGGHTKTSIIATISPALCNFDETISTLDYATKAKSITIKPEVNQKMTKRALIREYTEEIERLRRDLTANINRDGIYLNKENFDQYMASISEKEDKIKNLVVKIEALQEENRQIEESFNYTKEKLEKTCEQLDETTQKYENTALELSNTSNALVCTQEVLAKTALDRDEKEYLINIKKKAEDKLSHQAQMLLQVADETTNDVHKLHEKIDRKKNVEEQNENSCLNFKIMHQRQCAQLDEIISQHKEKDVDFLQSIKGDLDHFMGSVLEYKQHMSTCLHQISTCSKSNLQDFSSNLNLEASHERQWASNLLQNINSKKDTHVEDEQKFLNEKIPLHFNQLDEINSEAFNLFQDQYNNVCQKINQRKNAIETQKAKEKDLICLINDGLDSFLENHQAVVDNFTKQSKLALLASRENNEKLERIAAELFQINKEERNSLLKLEECGQKFTDVRDGLKPVKENIVLLEKEMDRDDLSEFDTITNTVNLQEIFEKKKAIQETQLSVSSEITKMLESSTKNKIEIVEELKTAFEKHDSEIVKTSEANQHKISDIITSLSETVEVANQYVEKCHESLRSSINETSGKVVESEQRQNQMTSEIKDKILKLHLCSEKFVSEDLAKDIATGDTPQRKTFTYPKDLVEFSPVDRVLERFRSQRAKDTAVAIHLPLDTSFNESEESKDTTQEDLGSGVTSHNTSLTNDGYDSADSNASSVSDISTESNKNKENCRNNKNSRLPRKVPKFKGFAKPAPVSGRKPLTITNSEVDSSNI